MKRIIDLNAPVLKDGERLTEGGIIVKKSAEEKQAEKIAEQFAKSQDRIDTFIKNLILEVFKTLDTVRDIDIQEKRVNELNGQYLSWLVENKEYSFDAMKGEFMERLWNAIRMDVEIQKQQNKKG